MSTSLNLVQNRWILLLLAMVAFTGCQQHPDQWVGNYEYEEDPVKAISGDYAMMEWKLAIARVGENYQGVLDVNGEQTYFRYVTDVTGDNQAISLRFIKQTDGSDLGQPGKGDLLFTLKRDGDKVMTKWGKLTPLLLEKQPNTCSCFKKN